MKSTQGVVYAHSNGISGQPALVDTAMPTQEPAVDVDLQDLYKQVLAVFNDGLPPEIPTPFGHNKTGPSNLESLYYRGFSGIQLQVASNPVLHRRSPMYANSDLVHQENRTFAFSA